MKSFETDDLIFIYAGGIDACQKGAVGTHTKGIINAFSKRSNFKEIHVLGSNLMCMNRDELVIHEIPYYENTKKNIFSKKKSFSIYSNLMIKEIELIICSHKITNCLIYHRYSLGTSYLFLKKLNKIKQTLKNITIVIEYNDLTVAQLRFANRHKYWSLMGGFLRTNFLTELYIKHLEKKCFNIVDKVVGVTDNLCEYINNLAKGKALLVRNATDASIILYTKGLNKSDVRKALGISVDDYLLIHAGTLTYWDGLIELLEGIDKSNNRDKIKLAIIGEGSLKAELKTKVAELQLQNIVSFHDPKPPSEIYLYIVAADLIPLLKTIDTYQLSPIKYYEALGIGKPILATNIPYINEIENLKYGAIVNYPIQIDEVTDTIDTLISKRPDFDLMRNEIQEYAQTYHTWDARVSTILKSLTN